MQYGIPYMGSKDSIVSSIAMALPPADNFYDLFGGGFAVSHYMAMSSKKYKNIHYNEIRTGIVELVQKAISGGFNYEVFKPEWISRDYFHENKDRDSYVTVCWSFGNNLKCHLFSREIEPYKRSMHQAVVFGEFDDLASEVFRFSSWTERISNIRNRRLYLRQLIEHYGKTKMPTVLHPFIKSKQLERLQQLEQLERLQRLEQLERLQSSRISFSSCSYEQVEIKPNSVVYCDIPYDGTAGYGSLFDRKAFLDWASSREFPVYISEYELDDDRFSLVYKVNKLSLLSPLEGKKTKVEKVFWNRVKVSQP